MAKHPKAKVRDHAAWAIWMNDNPTNATVLSWWDLSEEVRKEYLTKADAEDKITVDELTEWFGEAVPMEVFNLIFRDAPAEMTMAEMKAKVRRMGAEFRSPPSLVWQAHEILKEARKNGNLVPKLTKEIDAWEARYLLYRREVGKE